MSNNDLVTRFTPVPDFYKHRAWPPIGGLRHLIFNENENGFAVCVKRVGRRVLIDLQAFDNWVDNGGKK